MMIIKHCIALILASLLFCPLCQAGADAADKRLEGVVDIGRLVNNMELKTFFSNKKNAHNEALARKHLKEAGWIPNHEGVFTVRIPNSSLAFSGDSELGHFYIMPFTRRVISSKTPRQIATGSYVVVAENVEFSNYVKMSGFGYIGRGSHISGERYGILPFNSDFIRLLTRHKITSYIFTLTGTDVEEARKQSDAYELYLKCRFTSKADDYIRLQANIKHASVKSTNSRKILEYLLCVDVAGAFVYDARAQRVVCEWRVDPS